MVRGSRKVHSGLGVEVGGQDVQPRLQADQADHTAGGTSGEVRTVCPYIPSMFSSMPCSPFPSLCHPVAVPAHFGRAVFQSAVLSAWK
ncbi:hypothetical protein AMK11_35625 [Streptomyces sp. CB02414]|nr:hypothetical protein AMK11_35625 [Streptomyces sp. CB02414]